MAAEFDVSLLLTAPVGDLVLRLRTSTLSALSAALPSAVGLCGAGAGGAVLLFLGVLLEKGAEIGAAELVEYTQAAALAIESPHPEETGPLDRKYSPACSRKVLRGDIVMYVLRSSLLSAVVCRVCAGVAAAATQLGAPGTALDPVTTLIRKALPAHVLTTAHVDFVKLALAARAYNVAAATLDAMPLYAVAQGVTARDALLFHYYSGLVFCGAEAWAHATGMFKTVETHAIGQRHCSERSREIPIPLAVHLSSGSRHLRHSTGGLQETSSFSRDRPAEHCSRDRQLPHRAHCCFSDTPSSPP